LAGRSLDSQVETLIALANERGGHDNITVVLALC
jgi:serine/threonine protein phosphatase PrpC